MQVLQQVHVADVPPKIKVALKHQALDCEMSLSRWINCIFDYVTAHPNVSQRIYEEWVNSDGKLGTEPELPAIQREEVRA